jgi:hypothetical protein
MVTMTPQRVHLLGSAAPAPCVGVPDMLRLLASPADRAITVQVDDVGSCTLGGAPWPCLQVRLAEHNLAVL